MQIKGGGYSGSGTGEGSGWDTASSTFVWWLSSILHTYSVKLDSQGVYVPYRLYFAQFLLGEECAQLCDHRLPRMCWNKELM